MSSAHGKFTVRKDCPVNLPHARRCKGCPVNLPHVWRCKGGTVSQPHARRCKGCPVSLPHARRCKSVTVSLPHARRACLYGDADGFFKVLQHRRWSYACLCSARHIPVVWRLSVLRMSAPGLSRFAANHLKITVQVFFRALKSSRAADRVSILLP